MSVSSPIPALAAALLAVPIGLLAQAPAASHAAAKPAAKKVWTPPRLADGHPDLEGVWTNATITRMERPAGLTSLNLTDEQAKKFESADADAAEEKPGKDGVTLGGATFSGANAGYNVLFIDRGSELARVDGQKRSSLIVDPPNGKMPPRVASAGAGRRGGAGAGGGFGRGAYDSVKRRPASERCLIGFGSTAGPPMMPVLYNNNYEIVQTPDRIMILVEMVHDARIVRMNAEHEPANMTKWLGDSVGHWEGDTLVVDTTNFNEYTRFRGTTEKFHTVERFRRVDANTILYRVTLDDPNTWTQPWTMEYPFMSTPGPVYEYACHEGNYAMEDILGGERRMEDAATKK